MRQTNNDSQIRGILYTQANTKPQKNFMSSNYRQIKLIEEQNRLKKQKQDNYVERNLVFYKYFFQ